MNPAIRRLGCCLALAVLAGCSGLEAPMSGAQSSVQPLIVASASAVVDGKTYVRLDTHQLQTIIVGRQIIPAFQHSPHSLVMIFGSDGTYATQAGNDVPETGTYTAFNDTICVRLPGEVPVRRLFFQSADGELMMGTYNTSGDITWRKVFAKPL